MYIKTIELEGFKCFAKRTVFHPPSEPGLYLMTGTNHDQPELQGNAVGKSTLWDAVVWCLFGNTTRRVKASHVVSWQSTSKPACTVSVVIDDHIVTRTQGPNSLVLDGAVVVQADIERALGCTEQSFCSTCLFGQFSAQFFDLSPAEKLSSLSELLQLGLWEKSSVAAKGKVAQYLGTIASLERQHSGVSGQLLTLEDVQDRTRLQARDWENNRQSQIVDFMAQLKAAKVELILAEAELKKLPKFVPVDSEEIDQRLRELSTKLGCRQQEVSAAEAQYRRFCLVGPTCPTCYQSVAAEYRTIEKQELIEAQKEAEGRVIYLKAAQEDAMSKRNALRVQDGANREVVEQTRVLNSEMRRILERAGVLAEQMQQTQSAQNTHQQTLERYEKDMKRLVAEKDQLRSSMLATGDELQRAEFWVAGFRELRLWLIDACLAELEVEVNNSLEQLGLRGWSIRFDVERETKKGTVSRGFQVLIQSPDSDHPSPWNTWSGGELQRLRIAGSIGFGNLVLSRMGRTSSAIEIWDEPTAHLSEGGVTDLLEWLRIRAEKEGKSIWVIDHRSLDYGGFAGVLRVDKHDGASVLTMDGS